MVLQISSKKFRIFLGHTFCPIELKNGVLPIEVIQNQRKYQKLRAKMQILDFY
jgi:hypothetical protein